MERKSKVNLYDVFDSMMDSFMKLTFAMERAIATLKDENDAKEKEREHLCNEGS